MWSKSARPGKALVLLAAALLACSGGNGQTAKARPPGAGVVKRLDPAEVFPADLDLVVRIDVARMRAGIGPAAADALAGRALQKDGDTLLKTALACADVVWLGARLAELDAGDHVVVIEGKGCEPDLDAKRWKRVRAANAAVQIFEREGDRALRGATARVMILGPGTVALVSPMEVDSVSRVLVEGPDPRRGNPTAEGLLSVDLRTGRLPAPLERKFPSIGAIVAGLDRLRGSAVLVDEGLRIDAEIVSPTPKGAEKARLFLEALRDNVEDPRLAGVMKSVRIEQIERTVRLRVVVPAKVILAALSSEEVTPEVP